MRKINAWLFVTLDGVIEAPEKWVRPTPTCSEPSRRTTRSRTRCCSVANLRDVRRASRRERGSEVPNANWMNDMPKYVVSTTLESPE